MAKTHQQSLDDPDTDNPVVLAAKAVGSYKRLAELMGMTPQGIQKMKQTRVIDVRVLQMERVSGVSRHVIRPDLYPIEECPHCGFLIGAPAAGDRRQKSNGSREAR